MAVFFSPKCAGTSLRAFLFEVENGFRLQPYKVQGVPVDLSSLANRLVTNERFSKVPRADLVGTERIAVVRDPVKRWLSAYSNRVGYFRELSEEVAGKELKKAGLRPDPDIDLFATKFVEYAECSKSIARHFALQEIFVGRRQSYYGRVFRTEELDELAGYVNARCGTSASMPRLQDGGEKIEFSSLVRSTRRKIMSHVRKCVIYDWFPHYKEIYARYFK